MNSGSGTGLKVVLDCQKCGGTLSITGDQELFRCEFCGTPYLVKRQAGTLQVSRLKEAIDDLTQHQTASIQLERALSEEAKSVEALKRMSHVFILPLTIVLSVILLAVFDPRVKGGFVLIFVAYLMSVGIVAYLITGKQRRLEKEKQDLDESFLGRHQDQSRRGTAR